MKKQQATRKGARLADFESKSRRALGFSLLMLCLSVLTWCWVKVHSSHTYPITDVAIYGNYQHISNDELRSAIGPYVDTGFFAVDINALKNRIMSLPWVASVDVDRTWPNKVIINIGEQHAVAQWNNNQLLNNDIQTFAPEKNTFPRNLPILNGPEGMQALILHNFQRMNVLLQPLHTAITEIDVSPRQSWTVDLNNGMQILLGTTDIYPRLIRFIRVYNKVFLNKTDQVNYVDMRYNNGMSVSWKPQPQVQAQPQPQPNTTTTAAVNQGSTT